MWDDAGRKANWQQELRAWKQFASIAPTETEQVFILDHAKRTCNAASEPRFLSDLTVYLWLLQRNPKTKKIEYPPVRGEEMSWLDKVAKGLVRL